MNKNLQLLCLIVNVFIVLLGCKAYKTTKADEHPSLEELATKEFQSAFEIVNNRDSTHALVYTEIRTRPNQIFTTIEFFVYAYESGTKIHMDVLPQGKVRWVNDRELLCESIPGRVSSGESGKRYIFDVYTQTTKPYKN